MTTLGAWAGFTGTAVAADTLANALYSPSSLSADTFAKLHGRLDFENWGSDQIHPWGVQDGCFFAGFYQGFERWNFTYAKQKQSNSLYAVHAGLTRRFFLPWHTRVLLFGWNLWCRQDATAWAKPDAPNQGTLNVLETWTLDTFLDGTVLAGMRAVLPHTRADTHAGGAGGGPAVGETDPDNSAEDRWRYVSVNGASVPAPDSETPIAAKGYHRIDVTVSGDVVAPDLRDAKLATPTGALWMLAIRS